MNKIHKKNLLLAHNLARKQFGKTFPNPSVGCVLVKKNKILALSSTGINGRPHAEEKVLTKAGNSVGSMELWNFLKSDEAKKIIKKRGYELP